MSAELDKLVGKGIPLLSGIGDVAQMSINLAQTEDTEPYQQQIENYSSLASNNASSFDQLANMYSLTAPGVVTPSANELRGMDTWQKIGSLASAGLSGAKTGLEVGGGVGALIGGVVGLGAGAAGWIVGDTKAYNDAQELREQAAKAKKDNLLNLSAAGDRLKDTQFRSDYAHAAKFGGQIEKVSLDDFAKRSLRKPRLASYGQVPLAYKKTFCNGGLKVSIKVK